MGFRTVGICIVVLGSLTASANAQTAGQNNNAVANTATSPDVNLTPRRLVFGPSDRGVKEITVFNRSNQQATYTIALVDQVMTPDGSIVDTDKAPAAQKGRLKSATQWIRYSPRQVTLAPQSSQTVRVQARRPAELPAGEYRTHFSVTAVPPPDTGLDIATAAGAASDTQLKIKITPVYGIQIPIIVRTAELLAQATIDDVKVTQSNGRRALQFAVNRTGDRSVYGGFEAYLLGSGEPKRFAQMKGIGVYGEIDTRQIAMPIDDKISVGPGAKVRIVYTDDELKPGTVLAQTETTIR